MTGHSISERGQAAIDCAQRGMPVREIAKVTGLTRATVSRYLYDARRLGTSVPITTGRPTGDKAAEAVDLAKAGVRPARIAAELGLSLQQVYGHISYARRRGEDIPRFSTAGTRQRRGVSLAQEERDLLAPHAALRHIDVVELAERILSRVIEDNIVDAVLDDGARHD